MSEFGPTINIKEEQPLPHQEMLHRIYQIMQENKIYAVRSLFGRGNFELAHSDPIEEKELERIFLEKLHKKIPDGYLVFEGAHPDRETVLFKIKLEVSPDQRKTGHNEKCFYEDLLPEIEENMPAGIEHIKIPELYESGHNDEGSYVVTKFAEGEQLGSIMEAEKPLSSAEFDDLTRFIRFFQDFLSLEKVKSLSPNMALNKDEPNSTFEAHKSRFEQFKEKFIENLGQEYTDKMEQLLTDNEELIRSSMNVLSNQDIIPQNLVRSNSDLYLIDWERLKISHAASAYNHIIGAHWRWPELQNEMIKKVLEMNSDIPNFKELLRHEMIFYNYSTGLLYMKDKTDVPQAKQALWQEAGQAFVKSLKDAIDETGVWED